MRHRTSPSDEQNHRSDDLFQARLDQIIRPDYPLAQLAETMHRAQRLKEQKTKSKNKLYAFHGPEVECISKAKARQPDEFGVKASFAVTAFKGLIVGAGPFPGNPYDGDALAEQLEQTAILTDVPVRPL